MQCRTGHGYFGYYYQSTVPSESISCPCGEEIQTQKHIINTCPQYENYCQILHNVSSSIYMPDILGTKQGIAALSKFLKRTGAFTKNGTGPHSLVFVGLEDPKILGPISWHPMA